MEKPVFWKNCILGFAVFECKNDCKEASACYTQTSNLNLKFGDYSWLILSCIDMNNSNSKVCGQTYRLRNRTGLSFHSNYINTGNYQLTIHTVTVRLTLSPPLPDNSKRLQNKQCVSNMHNFVSSPQWCCFCCHVYQILSWSKLSFDIILCWCKLHFVGFLSF